MRIAIVTPAHNVAPHIATALRSVLRQTHDDWTMVVVDDGSTDNTGAIAREFANRRLRVVRQDNLGVSAARNTGLRHVDGDAVLFLDGDDWLAPDALERLARTLDASPWAIAAVGAYARVDAAGHAHAPVKPAEGALLRPLLVRNRFINGGHVLLRRDGLTTAGGFRTDLSFGEDWEFWVRVAMQGEFAAVRGGDPTLFALDRAGGAYRKLAADPDAFMTCLSAIHTNPDLIGHLDAADRDQLRRRAESEAYWVLGREMIRHGVRPNAWPWLFRSATACPTTRGFARLAASVLLPGLPSSWRGPFRPYAN